MPYYVMKTGLPMFDACRAYGLALTVERLAQAVYAVEDVTIADHGPFYLVNGPKADDLAAVSPTGLFDDLLTLTDGWCGALLTTGRATKAERLKPASRSNLEKKIENVKHKILDFKTWLGDFEQPLSIELGASSGKEMESLPASLDVSASKGIRRVKRNGYGEGEQLYAPLVQWAIGLLGGAHFIRWAWAGKDYAGLLATPQSVTMRGHHNVKSIADSGYLCSTSTTTVAAHYAVRLANALSQRKSDQASYADRYAALIVQTMTYSGNQWKAQTGTIFPIEYLMRLVDSNLVMSAEVLNLWDHVFRWGSVKGNEMLALTLAEFLGQPSIEAFQQHAIVHLRMTITDGDRRPFPPYQEDWMKEVLRYV
jgi:hypothetical protein